MEQHRLLLPALPIAALRMLTGIIFFLHAAARLYVNSLYDFGQFLSGHGFPFGFLLAWLVTLFELIGGIAMFLRYFVKTFCVGELIILITGIIIVHWQNGWFVVGLTQGGIEYSVVLISILVAIFIAESKKIRN